MSVSFNIAISHSIQNSPHRCLIDTILFCKRLLRSPRGSHLFNLILAQLCTHRQPTGSSVFIDHVLNILFLCTNPKVRRSNTCRIITAMKNKKKLWHPSVFYNPSDSVRETHNTPNSNCPITAVGFHYRPRPNPTFSSSFNFSQKSSSIFFSDDNFRPRYSRCSIFHTCFMNCVSCWRSLVASFNSVIVEAKPKASS